MCNPVAQRTCGQAPLRLCVSLCSENLWSTPPCSPGVSPCGYTESVRVLSGATVLSTASEPPQLPHSFLISLEAGGISCPGGHLSQALTSATGLGVTRLRSCSCCIAQGTCATVPSAGFRSLLVVWGRELLLLLASPVCQAGPSEQEACRMQEVPGDPAHTRTWDV